MKGIALTPTEQLHQACHFGRVAIKKQAEGKLAVLETLAAKAERFLESIPTFVTRPSVTARLSKDQPVVIVLWEMGYPLDEESPYISLKLHLEPNGQVEASLSPDLNTDRCIYFDYESDWPVEVVTFLDTHFKAC